MHIGIKYSIETSYIVYSLCPGCSHTNTSPCTSDVERDTQDTSPEEASRKRDTQDNSASSFEDPKPYTPGRDPVWAHGGDGLP
jgi:hypothetical protein